MTKYSTALKNPISPSRLSPSPVKSRTRLQLIADKAGICLSVICIIHCVFTPVILLALPAMQVFEWWHGSMHVVFAIIIPMLALGAFVPGFKIHRDARVFRIAAIGFALIICGITIPHIYNIEWLEPVFSIAGSAFLVRSHILNRSLCACCRAGHGKH